MAIFNLRCWRGADYGSKGIVAIVKKIIDELYQKIHGRSPQIKKRIRLRYWANSKEEAVYKIYFWFNAFYRNFNLLIKIKGQWETTP